MAAKKKQARREIPVTIRAGNIETDEALHDYILDRVSTRLARYHGTLHRISVRLDDLNGPKNSPAHRCALKVTIDRHESVMVEMVDAAPRMAFDRALDSAERAFKRSREKVRSKARRGATAKG
jgi:ribosome-associated translation inhibitor RaiA